MDDDVDAGVLAVRSGDTGDDKDGKEDNLVIGGGDGRSGDGAGSGGDEGSCDGRDAGECNPDECVVIGGEHPGITGADGEGHRPARATMRCRNSAFWDSCHELR